jgi:ribonuclease P protein component
MVMASDETFPRAACLRGQADFARVFDRRRSAAAGGLVLYACANESGTTGARLGLSVSRRVGNAVVRNRWKRRLREAFRRVRARLPPADYVVVVKTSSVPAGAAGARGVEERLLELAERLARRP